ncbi:MAG: HAD-IIA family hydrolase [Planctomycetota bacterium]|jgi:HAD superfamily hydrolase (TIGR01450 family)
MGDQKSDVLARLRAAREFIIDLDGTVYLSDALIDGSKGFIDYLGESGRRYVFITNNSSRTAEEYVVKLTRLGIHVALENIYTSLDATLAWLSKQPGRRVLPLGTDTFVEKVRSTGYEIVREDPDWVLLGFDTTLTYEKIRAAARALLNGAGFVATHPDLVCPTAEGPIPDTGSFIRMFEGATGKSPAICGKPYPAMVEGALSRLSGSTDTAAVIGGGGNPLGARAVG